MIKEMDPRRNVTFLNELRVNSLKGLRLTDLAFASSVLIDEGHYGQRLHHSLQHLDQLGHPHWDLGLEQHWD